MDIRKGVDIGDDRLLTTRCVFHTLLQHLQRVSCDL